MHTCKNIHIPIHPYNRALNEQVSALESWRKKAIEIERERERERTRWLGGSSKGDGAIGGDNSTGKEVGRREVGSHLTGGDEREHAMAGSAYYQNVARGVRNNIRSRVREELGQELQDRMRDKLASTASLSAISTHSLPHTSANPPSSPRYTSASPPHMSYTAPDVIHTSGNQDSPSRAGDLEISTSPPQYRADEQASRKIDPLVKNGKKRSALRAVPRSGPAEGGDAGADGGCGGEGGDNGSEGDSGSGTFCVAESDGGGEDGDDTVANGSCGFGSAGGGTRKDAEGGGGMDPLDPLDPLRLFGAAFDSFNPKRLSPESERKRERERERQRERAKEREKERERESQSMRKEWRDALLKDRMKNSGMQVADHEASSARPHPAEPYSSSHNLFAAIVSAAAGIRADASTSIRNNPTAVTRHADSRIEGIVGFDRESPPHSAAARAMSPEEFPATPWEKWAEENQNAVGGSADKDFDSPHADGNGAIIFLAHTIL